jgi:putative FmdB family regulatory protein
LAVVRAECQFLARRRPLRRPVPTYQYACTECGHAFEQFQSFSEDALTECPECHGRLRKLFNAVGVVFKGSGFYRTDSRAGASATDGGSSSSTTETKTETKTEKKAEAKPAAAASTSSSSSSD